MILVDAGNTRVKLALVDVDRMRAGAPFADAALDVASFANTDAALGARIAAWLAGRPAQADHRDRAHLAAVAPAAVVAEIERGLRAARPALALETVATRAELLGLRIAYRDPARLGVDRYVAMLGLWLAGAAPFVLASAGTALVVDAVDADGRHLGGLIAPSPAAMQAAVLDTTARVRIERAGAIADFGRSTEDGLASGAWHAAAALVERAAASAERAFGASPQLVLSGGDADTLATLVRAPHRRVDDAALRGLAAYAAARRDGRIAD